MSSIAVALGQLCAAISDTVTRSYPDGIGNYQRLMTTLQEEHA